MAEFKWLGHNCVRIRAREATVLTDPVARVTGYAMPKQTADIVTISHEHAGHINLDAVKPEYKVIRGPGEYEISDVTITGIRTYHDDQKGKTHGHNTVYLIELEGMVVCHLGDLGHALSDEQAEAMSNADVLLIPVGGGNTLTPAQAAELTGQLEPRVVIPIQYATSLGDRELAPLDAYCKELGVEVPAPVDKLVLRQSDLGENLRVVALEPDSEAARR